MTNLNDTVKLTLLDSGVNIPAVLLRLAHNTKIGGGAPLPLSALIPGEFFQEVRPDGTVGDAFVLISQSRKNASVSRLRDGLLFPKSFRDPVILLDCVLQEDDSDAS
jgi:hypothetical protein